MYPLIAVIYFTSAALADGRVALLLGAEKYQHFEASRISSAQITELEALLLKQGFTVSKAIDAGNATARAALSDFSHKAEAADFALIVIAGHFATYRNQSFFLPGNARVQRATDLFSRGLSASSIADVASKAKAGALLMLVTVPDISSTVAGISVRPDFATPPPANVVSVFSSSDKVPVSRVDSISAQAMKDLIETARENPMQLSALVDSASAGVTGRVFGEVKEVNLSLDGSKPPPAKSEETAREKALTDAERKARIDAETRLSKAEARARDAEQRAKETEDRAKREMAAAAAARQAAAAQAAEAQAAADAKAKEQEAAAASPTGPKTETAATPDIQSLQVVEALLGRGQRKIIQRLLKDMGLYEGPIDAIFGEQTREAIRAFQKKSDAPETGYLTPAQFQKLIASK